MLYIKKNTLINTGLFLLAVFLLVWPAINNGYPLMVADSSIHIVSGQENRIHLAETIAYGFFVRHISLSWSLWLVVILQSVIVNYVLYLYSKFIVRAKKSFFIHFLIILVLFFLTGIDYYTSFIAPDIFSSLSILMLLLVLLMDKKQKVHLLILSILILFSLFTKLLNIPLTIAVLLFLGLLTYGFKLFKPELALNRFLFLFGLIAFGSLLLMTVNYSYTGAFSLSRGNNVQLLAKLVESGVVKNYLDKNCSEVELNPVYAELCEDMELLKKNPPSGVFLWDQKSPLYAGDCGAESWENCWIEKNDEYGDFIGDIFSDQHSREAIIANTITGTIIQMITFQQQNKAPVGDDEIIRKYLIDDYYSYTRSIQEKHGINFQDQSLLEALIVDLCAIIFFVVLFAYWKFLDPVDRLLFLGIAFSLLINAFLYAFFDSIVPRNQGKIIFLLPFSLLVIALRIYKNKNSNRLIDTAEIL